MAMLPQYERLDARKAVFRIPFRRVALVVVSLPLFGVIFCILWSVLFDFDRTTYTHCDVPNYLPSLSAAIGNYEPQKTVWRFVIIVHLPGRFAVAKMYYNYYQDTIRRNRRIFANIACLLNVAEDLALFSLSWWSSADNYIVHRNSFIVFIICSLSYMLLSYLVNKNARRVALLPIEEKALRYKLYLLIMCITGLMLGIYCFVRHNSRCEPGVYSLFALFEYIVVLGNMSFHMTAFWDFYQLKLVFDWVQGFYLSTA